ncbi:hypothetical protein OOK31_38995 [Streptomyces sp. NBC_00249]|uniref:hypothetical protein n=1 Tax=Streptomyces sp. NBC_00249 TaxID=2975690 RepID=UPI00224E9249|nr:hypothetical protein [Streptomyces sp. NBC_00249]MCX5199798.1 hypothetical protein [Streptomyces sp. NBC_00249]
MTLLLLPLIPGALIAVLVLLGYGFSGLVRAGLRRAGREMWLRGFAFLLGGLATAFYLWGLLFVAGAVLGAEEHGAGSSPPMPCRTPGQEERAAHVIDYSVSYVPLRFVCETTGGGTYDPGSVPGYVNPAVLGFAVGAAACAGAARFGAGRWGTERPAG